MAIVELERTLEDHVESTYGPQVGERAPDFFIQARIGTLRMSEFAAEVGKVILISQDSYQFHPN